MNSVVILEHLYKILVIGDVGTGKTSLIKRLVHGIFNPGYKSTIGVDFAVKTIEYDTENFLHLQLWDIAGQEHFSNMTRIYYRDAHAALIVFDISRESTFHNSLKWKNDLDNKLNFDTNQIPIFLLANKSDLINSSSLNKFDLDTFCKTHNFTSYFKTSAKDNIGIDEVIKNLVPILISNDHLFFPKSSSPELTLINKNISSSNSSQSAHSSYHLKCCQN